MRAQHDGRVKDEYHSSQGGKLRNLEVAMPDDVDEGESLVHCNGSETAPNPDTVDA